MTLRTTTPSTTISLTTTSRRIHQVHEVVRSLLQQSMQPSRIVLWLSSEPHLLDDGVREGQLPPELACLQGEHFVIRWTRNIGSYRKLLPTLAEYGGLIVTADDDTLYPSHWLDQLLAMHADTPQAVCCFRAHRMLVDDDGQFVGYWRWPSFDTDAPSLDCFPTGKDGVLYPPECFHEDVFRVKELLNLAPTTDDIWFKAMALRRGTPARCVVAHEAFPVVSLSNHLDGLYARYNVLDNDMALARVFDAFELDPRTVTGREPTLRSDAVGASAALPLR